MQEPITLTLTLTLISSWLMLSFPEVFQQIMTEISVASQDTVPHAMIAAENVSVKT